MLDFYEVVGLFIDRPDEQMQSLRFAVDTGDIHRISELVHWLRGSGGNVGFTEYSVLCNQLELSVLEPLPSLMDDMSAIESYNRRVLAGWAQTIAPDADLKPQL